MTAQLIELQTDENSEIYAMIQEIGPGENGFENSLFTDGEEELQKLLRLNKEFSEGVNVRSGYVPQTIFWLYDQGRPVGYGKLRHSLNDALLKRGGHIGYVIRPADRGKGYGKILLRELLAEAFKKHILEALVTCDERNLPSRSVIEANNGKLREIYQGICKYWIKTEPNP